MPGLDYKTVPVVGVKAARKRFYDGTPGRELVPCADCGMPSDKSLGGDHGGDCLRLPAAPLVAAGSALEVIRNYAREHRWLSMNDDDLRAEMDARRIAGNKRGPAFGLACRKGWLEHVGYEPSKDGPTKGHHIKRYRSLLCPEAAVDSYEGR